MYSASRAVTDVHRPRLAEPGPTHPQYLAVLVLRESGPRTVRDVGTALSLGEGTVHLTVLLRTVTASTLAFRGVDRDSTAS